MPGDTAGQLFKIHIEIFFLTGIQQNLHLWKRQPKVCNYLNTI